MDSLDSLDSLDRVQQRGRADQVPALLSFEQACAMVLEHLAGLLPMGLWAVTRREAEAQTFLDVRGTELGIPAGAVLSWEDSLCRRMTEGRSPQVVPDVRADPAMATSPALRALPIVSYVGAPIRSAQGELFGTLCGYATTELPPEAAEHRPLLDLLASLLSQILHAEDLHVLAVEREAELHRRATTDDLTGLPTRSVFVDRLEHALALHRRDPRPLTVVVVDLDGFKSVNDSLGHAAGDELLAHLARSWAPLVRTGDTLARMGGDEFAVLVESSSGADVVARRLSEILGGSYGLVGTDLSVGASVGLAHLGAGDPTPTAADLLARADAAMYAAKRAGRGGIVTYDAAVAAAVASLPRPSGVVRRGDVEETALRGR